MLSISDFESPTIILQALLAGGGAVMAWRGAHISGDHNRRHGIVWGTASVATFVLTLFVGALGNHDAAQSVKEANGRADQSDRMLNGIQSQLFAVQKQDSSVLGALKDIAEKIHVNPDQSAQSLANQITSKLDLLQKDWEKAKDRIYKLENPPADPDQLYQGRTAVAKFWSGKYFKDQQKFVFTEISDASTINFSSSIFFRGLELECAPHGIDIGSYMGPHGMINNVMHDVTCDVTSGDIERPSNNLQSAHLPAQAQPAPPEKK